MGLHPQITKIVISIGVAYIDRSLFQKLTWLVVVLAAIGVFATLLMQAREKVHDLGIHEALGMTPRQVITMVACWAVAPAIIAAAIALPAGAVLEPVVARAIVSAQAGPAEDITPLLPGPPHGAPPVPPRQSRAIYPPRQSRAIYPPRRIRTACAARRIRAKRPARQSRDQCPLAAPAAPGRAATRRAHLSSAGHLRSRVRHRLEPRPPGELALLALAGLAIAIIGALGPAIWAAASRTTTALRAE